MTVETTGSAGATLVTIEDDELYCEACGEPCKGEDGTPVDALAVDPWAATDDGALMCCPACVKRLRVVTLDHVNPDADNPEFCAKCSRPLGQPHVDTCPVAS